MTATADPLGPAMSPLPPRKPRRRRSSKNAFKRLRMLPNFAEVDRKLRAGVSCETVARWLRESGLATDLTESGLIRQLYRYKAAIPYEDRAPVKVRQLDAKIEQFSHRVNVLEELTKLYEFQVTRLGKLIEVEEKSPSMLLSAMSREIDRAADILTRIIRLKETMGLVGKFGEMLQHGEGVADTAVSGALAVLEAKYGPQASTTLAQVGKRLMESLQRSLAATAPQAVPVAARVLPAPVPVPAPKLEGADHGAEARSE